MTADAPRIAYNILVMMKGSAHYAKAGQKTLAAPPRATAAIDFEFGGKTLRGVIAQVYTPPGCDEHCIGTVFVREA